MTRKDYDLIASVIAAEMELAGYQPAARADAARSALAGLVDRLADALLATNPSFDPARFVAACQTGADR